MQPGIPNDAIPDSDCDVLVIRSTRKISKEFTDRFKGKVIATFTKGTDHIDIDACRKNKIKVLSADEGNSISAAEHTMALMLAISKNLILSDKLVRKGKFKDLDYKRSELFSKKVGVIGYGSIGKKVARMCEAFGMTVYANDTDLKVRKRNKNAVFKGLKYILKNCDIITIHIPLENNVNFISKEKLLLLKPDSIIINTSRGEIMDEGSLLKLLSEEKIGFAGLDVFKNEPDISSLLFKLDNVILSNHIAGKTVESKKRIAKEVSKKIRRYFEKA